MSNQTKLNLVREMGQQKNRISIGETFLSFLLYIFCLKWPLNEMLQTAWILRFATTILHSQSLFLHLNQFFSVLSGFLCLYYSIFLLFLCDFIFQVIGERNKQNTYKYTIPESVYEWTLCALINVVVLTLAQSHTSLWWYENKR